MIFLDEKSVLFRSVSGDLELVANDSMVYINYQGNQYFSFKVDEKLKNVLFRR
jgi:hypothetical protein